MTEFDMSGKVAMVTGASSGFGVHFAKILAQRGAKVVVAARRVDRLESLVNEIKASGGEAMAVAMDVTNSDSIVSTNNSISAFTSCSGLVQFSVENAYRVRYLTPTSAADSMAARTALTPCL